MSKRIYSLQWSAVENAQTYRVFRSLTEVGNKQELVLTSNRSLELNQYIPGSSDYYYFIKAQAAGYQDSDYSTPLRWKTFSISRSVDTGVIETTDDSFVGEGFGFNTGFVAPGGKIFNRAVCLLTIGGIQHPEYISFLTGDKAFNIDIPAEAVTGDIVYSAVVQDEITQLATPTIAMNADGKTLEITNVANATSYDVYIDGTSKTNVASVPNTTTFDLSTLSDIADGTHTVKVKAKASGYNDSEFSNEVSYTKTPEMYRYFVVNSDKSSVSIVVYEYGSSVAVEGGIISAGKSFSGILPTNKIRIWTRGNAPTIQTYENCSYEMDGTSNIIVTADYPGEGISTRARIDIRA